MKSKGGIVDKSTDLRFFWQIVPLVAAPAGPARWGEK
jgi:hypothetical protein